MKQPSIVRAGLDVGARERVVALHRAERVEVMVVNPRAIKDFQRARLTRAKTDAVDALGILEFMQRMEFVPWTPPAAAVLALQQISRRLLQLREELTREQARLHAIAFTPDRILEVQ